MTRIRKAALIGIALATLLTLRWGAAAGVATTSGTLSAGAASVPRCDTDGVKVTQVLSGSTISDVLVEGIAPACAGSVVTATIATGGSGTAVVPVGGGQVTIGLTPATALSTSAQIEVVLTEP